MITTNRYVVLVGEAYYPSGWGDFAGSTDSLDEAGRIARSKIKVKKHNDAYMKTCPDSSRFYTDDWCEIVDLSDYSASDYDPSNEELAIMYIERQEKHEGNLQEV